MSNKRAGVSNDVDAIHKINQIERNRQFLLICIVIFQRNTERNSLVTEFSRHCATESSDSNTYFRGVEQQSLVVDMFSKIAFFHRAIQRVDIKDVDTR